ncbi:hypothetical protein HCJ52_14000 [Listeria sp. FSL L7-1485]|uniref:Uncharacterized protein n=1 Tax=Listeria immobilis TaxID=2713502 RepID=A0A7X0X9N3_9LIST|nr:MULTISPECIES: hypothetical protein [Listeria]MBC1481567.1 hypothetical protein [Listeria seeligeri]MBC1490124.1 hypothetical protein [Listeria immobilis]MBC1537226.1 hypothetical protein [Listeria immobilis]
MRDFLLRNIPDTTFAFMKDRADEANMSINKYMIAVLNQHAVLPEIYQMESKFSELVKTNIAVIDSNNQLNKQIIRIMEGE